MEVDHSPGLAVCSGAEGEILSKLRLPLGYQKTTEFGNMEVNLIWEGCVDSGPDQKGRPGGDQGLGGQLDTWNPITQTTIQDAASICRAGA